MRTRPTGSPAVAEIRRLNRRIRPANDAITATVAAFGSALAQLYGVGGIVATSVLARTGALLRAATP